MVQSTRISGSVARLFIVLLVSAAVLGAQTKSERERKVPEQPVASENPATTATSNEDPLFKGMKYRVIGPFRGGRSLTASGIAGRSDHLLFRRDRWRRLEVHRWRDHLDLGL